MTYGDTRYEFVPDYRKRSSDKLVAQTLFGSITLAVIALACGWVLVANLTATPVERPVEVVAVRPSAPATTPAAEDAVYIDAELVYSPQVLGVAPSAFSQNPTIRSATQFVAPVTRQAEAPQAQDKAASQPAVQVVQSVVMPKPRPSDVGTLAQNQNPTARAATQRNKLLANASSDETGILQKFFGKVQEAGTALAYAPADGGVPANTRSSATARALALAQDQFTAVYDISARTVYMPDGSKLEAHSGLGDKLDDPRYVHVRMHGATPPHTYDLTMREALFHGVEAIRLTPVGGEGAIYGRTGLLAHTYMLGPNGDSNGCVSFRNYNAFLRAFKNNEVKRLVVVSRV